MITDMVGAEYNAALVGNVFNANTTEPEWNRVNSLQHGSNKLI